MPMEESEQQPPLSSGQYDLTLPGVRLTQRGRPLVGTPGAQVANRRKCQRLVDGFHPQLLAFPGK